MEINETRIDDLNLELTLSIAKEDYSDKRRKKLNSYRNKAEFKGFRKGMVPMSLVERVYGQSALLDSVNDIISESLGNYIREQGLDLIGEPLPAEDSPEVEWTNGNDFTFKFEAALNPRIDIEISKDDVLTCYHIIPSDEAKAEMKENLLRQYGSLEEGETVGEEDFIVADFEQGDFKVEGTYVAIRNVDEKTRPQIVGLKAGDSIDVDVNEAFPNETDRTSMLKTTKEELEAMDPKFKLTVKNVKTFKPAPLTKETFDKIFGEGRVKSEEEFDAMVLSRLEAEYQDEAESRLQNDVRDFLIKKADLALPEKFLRRWITVTNEGKFTEEQIDKEFPMFLEDYRWEKIRDYIAGKYSIDVSNAEMMEAARQFAAYQFMMYGISDIPAEHIDNYAKNLLEEDGQSRRIYSQVLTHKIVAVLKNEMTLRTEEVTVEQFRQA